MLLPSHTILGKWFPLQEELAQSLKKMFFVKTNIKLNPFLYALFFFLCLQGQPELCGIYSMANLSSLEGPSFSSFAVLSSSLSMANQSCLLAASFSSPRFLSNSFSSPRFNL